MRTILQSMFMTLSLALAAASAFATGGGAPPEMDGVRLRLVTLNVLEGIGAPGSSAYNATGAFLTTVAQSPGSGNTGLLPHVVALQECRSDANLLAFRDQFLPGFNYYRTVQSDPGGNFNAYFVHPDLNVIHVWERYIGGPRSLLRLIIEVPGADNLLAVYNVHFKAFGDTQSQNQRRLNAIESGIIVYKDLHDGVDVTGDNVPDHPPPYAAFMGDLNSNNNNDGTITNLFTHITLGVPTGVRNLPVESIGGRKIGGAPIIATFPGSNSRLDYICLSDDLAAVFDADQNGSYSQNELNTMGYVYYSGDDQGQQSNGNASATSFASDHRPVVFDVFLGEAATPCPGDTNGDNVVDFADFSTVLNQYGQTGPGLSGDLNGDQTVDFTDFSIVLANYGESCD